MAVDPSGVEALIADLHARGVPVAARIGEFTDRAGVATAALGNKIHFVSGKITSGGYGDPGIQASTGSHDVLEITDK